MNLEQALLIATKAHKGQVDKGGSPYILHPLRVMFLCEKEEEKICALLHDVIEDTYVTLEDLRKEGFSEGIMEAVEALTRRDSESYDAFIDRLKYNAIASRVKLADLEDNMNLSRIANPREQDYQRIEKYKRAQKRILVAINGGV